MIDERFLVARVKLESVLGRADATWIPNSRVPYEECDVIEFPENDLARLYHLYERTYAQISKDGALNLASAQGLFEYNRFILVEGDSGTIVAFVLAKATPSGTKLCATATDGSVSAKKAVILLHIDALNVSDVYAEVSDRMEEVLTESVLSVGADVAAKVLDKKVIEPDADGVHYTRNITNLGPRKKKMVGKPRV